jgi:hypothetical protein
MKQTPNSDGGAGFSLQRGLQPPLTICLLTALTIASAAPGRILLARFLSVLPPITSSPRTQSRWQPVF